MLKAARPRNLFTFLRILRPQSVRLGLRQSIQSCCAACSISFSAKGHTMNPAAMLRYGLSFVMTLVVVYACWADDAASPASMEIIQFTAPAGWQMAEKPGQAVRIFTSPDSDASQQAVILV